MELSEWIGTEPCAPALDPHQSQSCFPIVKYYKARRAAHGTPSEVSCDGDSLICSASPLR